MPDARHPGNPAPEDWGQAFAALPLETPPTGGWNRLEAALPARARHRRFWIPAAVAACLALAMAVPWRGVAPDQAQPVAVSVPPSTTPAESVPATSVAAFTPSPAPVKAGAGIVDDGEPVTPAAAAGHAPLDTGLATAPAPAPKRRDASIPRPSPAMNDAPDERRTASTAMTKHADAPVARPPETTGAPASPAALETLYAESAQLEALLAQIRDDRVASGPAMALSAALNERVAGIDVALSQPDLPADTRVGLWRERVAVLQRLTGVESTQRWMAANGYQADGAVAQVY